MKNKKIRSLLLVLGALILIVVGVIFGYDKDANNKPSKESSDQTQEVHPDYHELGPQSLKEDQIFDNIKYTQNHLSSTSNTYATFTSVVFNQTEETITMQKLEIDFYDEDGKLLATMESEIELLKVGESTVIYGIVEENLTKAHTFKVRKV